MSFVPDNINVKSLDIFKQQIKKLAFDSLPCKCVKNMFKK